MGNQVTVSFLTDHWHDTKKNPQAVMDGIDRAMNYGNRSYVHEVLNTRYDPPRPRDWPLDDDAGRYLRTHYVTVHRSRHMSEAQILVNHENSSTDVWDFAHAIGMGLLDLRPHPDSLKQSGRRMVDELRRQADVLERALENADKTPEPEAEA